MSFHMRMDFFEKPAYGQKAAELWKEITGNYPLLPDQPAGEEGAVLLNSGDNQLHVVGFFGFKEFPDQVNVFDSYLIAEQFYKNAKDNPRSYRHKPARLPKGIDSAPTEIEEKQRPKFIYEGSGDVED